jgi:hypothetical protein
MIYVFCCLRKPLRVDRVGKGHQENLIPHPREWEIAKLALLHYVDVLLTNTKSRLADTKKIYCIHTTTFIKGHRFCK